MPGAPLYVETQEVPQARLGQGTMTRAIPSQADGSDVASAIMKIGTAVGGVAAAVKKAQDDTADTTARTNAITRISALRDEHDRDPDYSTSLTRFAEKVKDVETEELDRLSDPTQRSAAQLYIRSHALAAGHYVRNRALSMEADANRQSLDVLTAQNRKLAANAGSPVEVQEFIALQNQVTAKMAEAGWITPQEQATRDAGFVKGVDQDNAAAAAQANPLWLQSVIHDPRFYTTFTPQDREAYDRQAAAVLDSQDTAATRLAARDGVERLSLGTLDANWITENTPHLSEAHERIFTRALTAPPVPGDPKTYAALLSLSIDDVDGAGLAAARARGQSELSDGQMRAVIAAAGRSRALAEKGAPYAGAVRASMLGVLQPTPTQDREEAARQLEALAEMDEWLLQNPDAPERQARDQAETYATQARTLAASRERGKLPMPRFAPPQREKFDAVALTNTGARLRDAFNNKALTEDQLVEQVELLRRWRDVMQREGKAL